jgi:hypothetical protein
MSDHLPTPPPSPKTSPSSPLTKPVKGMRRRTSLRLVLLFTFEFIKVQVGVAAKVKPEMISYSYAGLNTVEGAT